MARRNQPPATLFDLLFDNVMDGVEEAVDTFLEDVQDIVEDAIVNAMEDAEAGGLIDDTQLPDMDSARRSDRRRTASRSTNSAPRSAPHTTGPQRPRQSKPQSTYYDTLEVRPDASYDEIHDAFRRLMRQYHPDKPGNRNAKARKKAAEVSEAWSVLKDQQKRVQYNQQRGI